MTRKIGLIDSHLHLAQYPAEQVDAYINDWHDQGVTQVVAVATDLASAYRTLELKQHYPDFVYAAIGYHPEQHLPSEQELQEILRLLQSERVQLSAIGEVGLPHYTLESLGGPAVLPAYTELLAQFAAAAVEYDLPLILHAVHDKADQALSVLKQQAQAQQGQQGQQKLPKAHFHWLKAPPDVVDQIVSAGCYISVTPEVCYRERDQQLALRVPTEQLLIETDGPWPYGDRFAGRMTSPLFLKDVAECVAKLKSSSHSDVLAQLTSNMHALYGRIEIGLEGI